MKRFFGALALFATFAFVGTLGVTLSGCYSCPESTCSGQMLEREVTVSEYDACVQAGACTPPNAGCQSDFFTTRPWLHADLPVGCVGFEQAKSYCGFIGGALPLDFEWEYAFRNGGDDSGFTGAGGYVWCEDAVMVDPNSSLVGCGRGETWPGCTHSGDVTEQGICDLVGNLKEWVQPVTLGVTAAVWGISAWSSELGLTRSYESAGDPDGTIGFRCMRRSAP